MRSGIDVGELRLREGRVRGRPRFTDGRWFVKLWRHDTPDERALALTRGLAARGFPSLARSARSTVGTAPSTTASGTPCSRTSRAATPPGITRRRSPP